MSHFIAVISFQGCQSVWVSRNMNLFIVNANRYFIRISRPVKTTEYLVRKCHVFLGHVLMEIDLSLKSIGKFMLSISSAYSLNFIRLISTP